MPKLAVEGQIEHQDVHPRLSEDAPRTSLGMAKQERPDGVTGYPACSCDSCNLQRRVRRRDVRIESTARPGNRIGWYKTPLREAVLGPICCDELFDAGERFVDVFGLRIINNPVQQLVAQRPEIGSARVGRIVSADRKSTRLNSSHLGISY